MIALIALAGGVGAALRFVVDGVISQRVRLPWGTLVVNVTGSFLLGLLVAAVGDLAASDDVHAVLGTGLLGGYTTFSAASVEAVNLARGQGRRPVITAVLHATAMLVLGLLAAGLGLWLG